MRRNELLKTLKKTSLFSLLLPSTPMQKLWTIVFKEDIDQYIDILQDMQRKDFEGPEKFVSSMYPSYLLPDWEMRETIMHDIFLCLPEITRKVMFLFYGLDNPPVAPAVIQKQFSTHILSVPQIETVCSDILSEIKACVTESYPGILGDNFGIGTVLVNDPFFQTQEYELLRAVFSTTRS